MSFELENENAESFGLYFKKRTLFKELLKPPKIKEPYTKNWPDQHGTERDTISPTRFESIDYSPICYLIGDNIEDLINKRSRVIELLSNPKGFLLNCPVLGRSYRLYYKDIQNFNVLTPMLDRPGKLYCEFTLNLINNFDEVGLRVKLRDINSFVLTELGQQIYVSINKQLF